MRRIWVGILGCLGVLVVTVIASSFHEDTFAQTPDGGPSDGGEMIALSALIEGQHQQVVVIDPQQRSMGVYRINPQTGDVRLCCVRSIAWDLRMMHFNGEKPLPEEIRDMQLRGGPQRSPQGMNPPAGGSFPTDGSLPY